MPPPRGSGLRAALPGGAFADAVGHPLRFHASTAIGAASQSAGIGLAALAIANGMASVVVIPNVAAGRPAGYAGANRDEAVAYMARLGSPYEYVWGTTRVADFAVVARRHMHEFGTTEEQLAEVAVAQRYGATLNPLSVNGGRGEITIDDVMRSRPIAEPLKLLDCCLVNQGAGCIVMTSTADARATGRHAARRGARLGRGPQLPRSVHGAQPRRLRGRAPGRRCRLRHGRCAARRDRRRRHLGPLHDQRDRRARGRRLLRQGRGRRRSSRARPPASAAGSP